MEQLNQAKELIQDSKNILIFISKDILEKDFKNILILSYTLDKLGKNVNLSFDKLPKNLDFLVKDLDPCFLQKNLTISIDAPETRVSQIYFEKNETGLNLHLISQGETIDPNNIKLNSHNFEPQLLISAIKDNDSLNLPKDILKISSRVPCLNILNADSCSLADTLNPLISPLKEKVELGLLTRVLEKLNFSLEKKFCWAVLDKKDFESLQAKPKDLAFVIKELKFNFWRISSLFILWEGHCSPPVVKGIFYSNQKIFIDQILKNFDVASKKQGGLIFLRDKSLKQAEKEVLKVLNP